MSDILNINIDRPIGSISEPTADSAQTFVDNSILIKTHFNSHLQKIDSLCSALSRAIEQTSQIKQQAVSESKEEIARLAVDIAEMIIADKIAKDDYDIEKIIIDTIKDIPDKSEIEIELSEHDEKMLREKIAKDSDSPLKHLKITANEKIDRTQCSVKTQNGKIESFYKEQLEKIAAALGCNRKV